MRVGGIDLKHDHDCRANRLPTEISNKKELTFLLLRSGVFSHDLLSSFT